MANRKISDLTALTAPATGDLLPIVDISEAAAADKNKKITIGELFASIPAGTAAAPSVAFEGDSNTGIFSPGADQVAISTNGTGRLFVNSAGNAGLGTSAPNYQLHVTTDFAVGASGFNQQLSFTNDTIQSLLLGTGYTPLKLNPLGGNVGIGTIAPAEKLDVFGVIRATNTTDSNFYGTFSNPDGLTRIGAYGGGSSICFDLGASEKARIDSSGRLLVGTSSDSGGALLQVNGDRIRIGTAKTPASAGATGTTGEIAWDANYIYVCTATNTWKRTAIATW